MQLQFRKQLIPWAMAGMRAALGPVLITGAACQWNGLALAAIVVVALVSDIYDGVLARRWQCDTSAVRLFDSMADTVFYLCTAIALWLQRPMLWHTYAAPLITLLTLEAVRFAFDLHKFGKPSSYHSWLAKSWGLTLAIAVIAVFAQGWISPLVPLALWTGIACDLEGLAMSIVLPVWRKDIKTLRAAWRLRCELAAEATPGDAAGHREPNLLRIAGVAALLACALPLPLFAVEAGQAAYVSGTSSTLAKGAIGSLDTTSPATLIFRAAGTGAGGELDIPWTSIRNFQYTTEVARHLGVLPAIAVGLVRRRERKHFFSITYVDASNAPQAAVFEVPKREPRGLLAILRARAPQACGKTPLHVCGGFIPD